MASSTTRTGKGKGDDAAVIERLVKRNRRVWPKRVQSFRVELGEDWTGDPAAYIIFLVKDDSYPSDEEAEELARFSDSLIEQVLEQDVAHWPHVRFDAAA